MSLLPDEDEFPRIGEYLDNLARARDGIGGDVELVTCDDGAWATVFLSPLDARALATQLLKAARWAEGDRT